MLSIFLTNSLIFMSYAQQHQIHTVGSKVWVSISSNGENEENEWYPGEVILVDGETVHVRTNDDQEIQVSASEAPLQNATGQGGMEDMTKLSYLHEPGVLHNLDFRYSLDEIYTYTGNILIAVNPFQRLPHLYDSFMMEQYKGIPLGDLSPHVFAVADEAYRFMRAENKSQSILVSGESGAGKTETTKLIMQVGLLSEGLSCQVSSSSLPPPPSSLNFICFLVCARYSI